jgi:hypothetical protein
MFWARFLMILPMDLMVYVGVYTWVVGRRLPGD